MKFSTLGTVTKRMGQICMDDSSLPAGWVESTLGEVRLDRSQTTNPSALPEEMFELYSVPSFSERTPEIIAGADIGSSKRTVDQNTVLEPVP